MTDEVKLLTQLVNPLMNLCHSEASGAGWWDEVTTETIPAKLCLIHSEVSEAMEGHRKDLMDSHLPDRPAIEVELADAIIRIYDLGGYLGMDLGGAIRDKILYNRERLDHKRENRASKGGKVY